MAVRLKHTIVAARDSVASATFLAQMLSLEVPVRIAAVRVGDTSLDFSRSDGQIHPQHYAFLVSEGEFHEIFGRVRNRGLTRWANPFRREPGRINHWYDGRGVYFEDPNGHLLEILTRPYESGGTAASKSHPLIDPKK
jgi:hypothetical protein